MKRILLLAASALLLNTAISYAQWVRYPSTGTTTGMYFSGGTANTASTGGWGGYTPTFTDASCASYATQYFGGSGANSGSPKDSTNQVDYTMATIANGGDNGGAGQFTAGWAASPSFSMSMNGGTNLDLSSTSNRTLSIKLRSTVAFTAQLLLLDGSYQAINSHTPPPSINILGDNAFHVYTINFDTSVVNAAINSVFNISFVYNSATPLSGRLFVKEFSVGSAPAVTAVNSAAALVTSTKLYPNPVSDQVNLELNLQSQSDVKVTLSDMMGREVMTVAEGSMASLSKEFSVANLNKGIYTVNYFVNGAAARAELLMVK